jgi:hypothetical protein
MWREEGELGKLMQKTERENKLNGGNIYISHTSRSESTTIIPSRQRAVYIYINKKMRNSGSNDIMNKKWEKICMHQYI